MTEELKPYAWEIKIPGCDMLSYVEPDCQSLDKNVALYSQQQVDALRERVKRLEEALENHEIAIKEYEIKTGNIITGLTRTMAKKH